ncbi:hypothetical protein HanIR_Chr03g0102861 [Helianthus annuus]|nr:hypothetical protein HanIR_Chr03g0102861 [Helianthus annuus]
MYVNQKEKKRRLLLVYSSCRVVIGWWRWCSPVAWRGSRKKL